MPTITDYIESLVDELPDEAAELVRARIKWEIRAKPTAEDLERGAAADDRGYFYGFRVRGEDELELEGEGEGEGEVFLADEGDDVAEVPDYKPGGVIVLFTANIGKLTPSNVTEVVMHELAHFLGEDEEGAFELGLGDDEIGAES